MSQAAPWGRLNPRWSVAGQSALSPASMAGLPGKGAWVSVAPPLFCSGPNNGSSPRMLGRTPLLRLQALVISLINTYSESGETAPWQSPLPLLAIITLCSRGRAVPKLFIPPPPLTASAVLLTMVTLYNSAALLLFSMAPPLPEVVVATLPLKVTLVRIGLLSMLYMPPPPESSARLPTKVTFTSVGLLLSL